VEASYRGTFDFLPRRSRKLFEQKGRSAFLADNNLSAWLFSNAVGGVKLQVAISDVDQVAHTEHFKRREGRDLAEHPKERLRLRAGVRKECCISRERCGFSKRAPLRQLCNVRKPPRLQSLRNQNAALVSSWPEDTKQRKISSPTHGPLRNCGIEVNCGTVSCIHPYLFSAFPQ